MCPVRCARDDSVKVQSARSIRECARVNVRLAAVRRNAHGRRYSGRVYLVLVLRFLCRLVGTTSQANANMDARLYNACIEHCVPSIWAQRHTRENEKKNGLCHIRSSAMHRHIHKHTHIKYYMQCVCI